MRVHLTGVCLMGVHLKGVHLTDVHVMGLHLMGVHLAVLTILLPPPLQQDLESIDAVQARLQTLVQMEDHNNRKRELLSAKRRRKDKKIPRKGQYQDRKFEAIRDARKRQDARIKTRRPAVGLGNGVCDGIDNKSPFTTIFVLSSLNSIG
jgi:hypothetical protein